ncbi:NADPH:quinone reductase-like Zn-dependent oxidoreductase [Dyadobacter sp. BE34]|uniref:NADPH:quinone reductase-like Zn-dependent oxidoreductase n=1 Tax=Dyadobacter fermentans TaxID=94254 RepID=A0ABU1R058_9BACT|nr:MULTISPECIES: NADP-dependent oxidoreductase [Dyadobacter]MDR6806345.1 NADPH:quinone reductase-like Zn-dependent oxidoreductase [Dyadobacter fermentans]MDR7044086.1 NADPH:quinone reductase-like Zn-dependent oxidoreductase [Dyadobacter sp. BE242]MDR7198397.1 NADPH:quinone reductase-like Zn-dependent oxidoreductase [Dyadobacter sp. BE34]MDR7216359.1 NADPH:quinone reductase-like Zn-dependent oxidoreductase [Dyadobacter sp. BE31]MDR7264114.1 NADPH:quinone reductase-like Zn-dependent oxidoreducta
MKAITLASNGGTENLIFTEIPTPAIKENEVLVRVKAIGINPVDAFVRTHPFALEMFLQPQPGEPVIIGWDISGVVEALGKAVTQWKPGDEVFGMVNFRGHGKAYAEYVAAPADQLALKPGNISHEEAAAATLAALTAWQALVTYGKVKTGEKVLIHRAGGGVGHYAVQIAKHFGAYVIGTGSAAKKDFILGLGADEFIDYTATQFEDIVQDADIVIDSLFGDHIFRSLDAVKEGGRLIALLVPFTDEKLIQKVRAKKVYAHTLNVSSSGEDMGRVAALLRSGEVRSHVSATYAFEDITKAHDEIETGKTIGKIVVSLP